MEQRTENLEIRRLAAFIGKWSMEVDLPGAPPGDVGARTAFEWLPGERFLVQRWEVPVPAAPDGQRITGRWESSKHGSSWEHDFNLTYVKVPG